MNKWWEREITAWLDKLGSASALIRAYGAACASYEWKQLCIKRAIERWPNAEAKLSQLYGRS